METQTLQLAVKGMHCGSCAGKIQAALSGIAGVDEASVSHHSGTASVAAAQSIAHSTLTNAVASAGDYSVTSIKNAAVEEATPTDEVLQDDAPKESLYPLFLIVGFIAGVTALVAYSTSTWAAEPVMRNFMAGFFIVFAFFKLLDPPGFVSAYRDYDLIARKIPAWGWAYPFVELALGVAYLLAFAPLATNAVTLVLMLVGAAGVLKALLDKRTIRCACLGTALNLPMTKVTLVEDLTMAAMAAAMLLIML
jgi:cation transport ATPase